jgi:prepilin-type N-terminal cleavage/methylation domain-containing protein
MTRSNGHSNSALCTPAFTLVEMLVVLGIIALVAALSLPMIVPIMRSRTLNAALDTVKSACILARSMAIQQRKMVNLTLLQQTDSLHGPGVVLTGYNFAGVVTAFTAATPTSYPAITDNNQAWTTNCFSNCQILIFSPLPNSLAPAVPAIGTITSNTTNTIYFTAAAWSAPSQYYPNNMASTGSVTAGNYANYVCTAANSNQQPPNANWLQLSLLTPGNPVNVYVVTSCISPTQPYCIHYPGNYSYNVGNLMPDDIRFLVLKTFSQYMGQTVQYLPAGCQFDFTAAFPAWSSSVTYYPGYTVADKGIVYYCTQTNTASEPKSNPNLNPPPIMISTNANWQVVDTSAWTYVFLPDGEAWTLLPSAQNVRDTNWLLTTYMVNGAVSGPKIWGPQNLTSATIVVYATTGQVLSQ